MSVSIDTEPTFRPGSSTVLFEGADLLVLGPLAGRAFDIEPGRAVAHGQRGRRFRFIGEEGMLNYEWSLSEDGKTCHILERYADSDALRAHLETFGAFAERFFGMVDIVNVEVYGSPDGQVREALSQASNNSAKFNRPYAGFVR